MQKYISEFTYENEVYGFVEHTDLLERRIIELVGNLDCNENRHQAAILIFDGHEGLLCYIAHYPSYEIFYKIEINDLKSRLNLQDDFDVFEHWIANTEYDCDWDFVVNLCRSEIIDKII